MASLKYGFYSILFALCFCETAVAERKHKILVLHSYHQGLEWSDNISRGIRSVFSYYREQYEIHYEYLDTKRNTGEIYTQKLLQFMSSKYDELEYEAVIVSDNNALRMLNDGQVVFSGNPLIIFCGINNFTDTLTDKLSNTAGVVEKADHRSNIELIRQLHPDSKRITIILDQTPTGDAIKAELTQVEVDFEDVEFNYLRDFTLGEVDDLLTSLGDEEPIYLLTFNRDRNNQFISYTEGIEMLNKSAKGPIYGAWDFYMGKGLVGGRIVSGYLQGKKAAEITLELISKPNANALTVIADTPTKYMFDYRYLEEHGISISALPEHSEVIYEPESAYERYKHWLIGLSAFSMAAALFVLWKYRTQQLLLKSRLEHNRKLELTVYERTMELEITNKKLKQLSNLDGLTQLFNRRFFDESIDTEIKRSQRASTPLSLLMCDIDLFKKFNDTHGHLAGDDCIKLVADSIQQSCNRVTDVVARYGGEEFAAILPNTDSAGAEAIAKSIQSGLAEKNISFEHSQVDSKVTISIGLVTVLPEIDTSPNDVIAMADKALYTSKHKGRNRITVYLPEQP